MPWTLWRYISIEVSRLILISTAVLVAVISFAAAIKPLADGKLSALTFLKFILLAIPPMLAYALPFASGFGATLAYHRLAQDNEILAAKAGGFSHRRLLMPALTLGLGIALMLGVLNEQVIPRFLTRMERLVTQDVTQIMVRTIERGESVRVGATEIYADAIQRVPPRDDSGVLDQYLLAGVVGVDLADAGESEGQVETVVTARRAWLFLAPGASVGFEDDTLAAVLRFEDLIFSSADGRPQRFERLALEPLRVPNPFKDDPKFLTAGELIRLRSRPEEMNWIDANRVNLAREYASVETMASLRRRLREDGLVRFTGPRGEDVMIRSAALNATDGWMLEPSGASGRVEVEIFKPEGAGIERYAARRAHLQPDRASGDELFNSTAGSGLRFTLRLDQVELRGSTADLEDMPTVEKEEHIIAGLAAPDDPMTALSEMNCRQLLQQVQNRTEGAARVEYIAASAETLRREIAKLQREITSKQHERMAMAVSCLVMVLTGAVTAMKLREALPLVVYLWSFFPALLTIILISSGQQTIHNSGLIGAPVLWGGVLLLAAYTLVTFRVLSRH